MDRPAAKARRAGQASRCRPHPAPVPRHRPGHLTSKPGLCGCSWQQSAAGWCHSLGWRRPRRCGPWGRRSGQVGSAWKRHGRGGAAGSQQLGLPRCPSRHPPPGRHCPKCGPPAGPGRVHRRTSLHWPQEAARSPGGLSGRRQSAPDRHDQVGQTSACHLHRQCWMEVGTGQVQSIAVGLRQLTRPRPATGCAARPQRPAPDDQRSPVPRPQ